MRGRNREHAKKKKKERSQTYWAEAWVGHCWETKKLRQKLGVQVEVKASPAKKIRWGLQGESICLLIRNLKYLELNCL